MSNLELWNAHRTPHKDALKPFNRGFSGTAIDPMWLIREATEEWGPMGDKWGYVVDSEEIIRDLPEEKVIHVCRITMFYPGADGGVAHLPQVGQTWLVQKTKNGLMVDEEAPKKSRTDALTKGLSWLGFGADIHMGMFDGNKYVDLDMSDEERSEIEKERAKKEADAKARKERDEAMKPILAGVAKSLMTDPKVINSLETINPESHKIYLWNVLTAYTGEMNPDGITKERLKEIHSGVVEIIVRAAKEAA